MGVGLETFTQLTYNFVPGWKGATDGQGDPIPNPMFDLNEKKTSELFEADQKCTKNQSGSRIIVAQTIDKIIVRSGLQKTDCAKKLRQHNSGKKT